MVPSFRALWGCNRAIQHHSFPCLSNPRTSARLYHHLQSREYANQAAQQENTTEKPVLSKRRVNELGVQQLSSHVHSQVFFKEATPPPPELVELSKCHLSRHGLFGKNTDTNEPISFNVPPLQGNTKTLDEHFFRLGMDASEPYISFAKTFANLNVPPPPQKWERRSGWTKYHLDGTTDKIDKPNEDMIVFDVEVLYKVSPFAVMACAASPTAWYAWISPWILGESDSPRHLVPLGDPQKAQIIIGHNVGYDRARVAEEYNLEMSKFAFLDTMSLHVAANGMCSRQRPTWLKHRKVQRLRERVTSGEEISQELSNMLQFDEEQEAWIERSSINSLLEVAKFHCNVDIDKDLRDQFGVLDRDGVSDKLGELLDYCAADVAITHQVYKKVLPLFLNVCPHPVSFAALRHLSSVILPVNRSWETYIENAEATYLELSKAIEKRLVMLAEKALDLKDQEGKYMSDPWLRQLDWSRKEIRWVKGKRKNDPLQPSTRQKHLGVPKWYRDLLPKASSTEVNLSVRTRISPLLLRLMWNKEPLVWSDRFGWIFRVPSEKEGDYKDSPVVKCDMTKETNPQLKDDTDCVYFKLPHNNGPTVRCTAPLAKSYLKYFEEGILSSEYPLAKEALEMNAACSYWISARQRIRGQMVIYNSELVSSVEKKDDAETKDETKEMGIILPQIIPMGTITRRAVESTWLTASNAKRNRVGSELKAMVIAPEGYVFVGADVDSQELWIASLVGDAQFKLHGGNAIGFMTLEGTKSAGTDLHSKTAKILGISRNSAKIFNYGRIYGAGVKFASTLLRQFNPALSDTEALKISENLYKETKGQRTTRKAINSRVFWRGGTESFVFNKLEEFADQDEPRTPVLGAGITEALRRELLSLNGFMPSRINWAIQSSGVDYLHLLIVSMDHLIRRFKLQARLAITVHDEIRYLVKEEHKYKVAMALQVANLWTRAMFSQQMGIEDLPQSCAYFSAIDIDSVLRKEVDMDCITPSHLEAIPPGESLDITELLEKDSPLDPLLDPQIAANDDVDFNRWEYTPRVSIMQQLQETPNIPFLKAQAATDDELNTIVQVLRDQKRNFDINPPPLIQEKARTLSRRIPTPAKSMPTNPIETEDLYCLLEMKPINWMPIQKNTVLKSRL